MIEVQVERVCQRAGLKAITLRELLEWTYAVQRAHKGGDIGAGGYAGISQTGIVAEVGALGCIVDRSRGGAQYWGRTHCDDDALTVHSVVERMPYHERLELIRWGEAQAVPKWQPVIEPLRIAPMPGRKGANKGIYDQSGNCIGCVVQYEGMLPSYDVRQSMRYYWPDAPHLRCADEVTAYARNVYAGWYNALHRLFGMLPKRLDRHFIVTIGAHREPWRNITCVETQIT